MFVVDLSQLCNIEAWTDLWLLSCLVLKSICFCDVSMLPDCSRSVLSFRIITMTPAALFFFTCLFLFLISFWFAIFCGYMNSIDFFPFYLFIFKITSHYIAQASFTLALHLSQISECCNHRFLPLTFFMIIYFIFFDKKIIDIYIRTSTNL